eukprot:4519273-Amphidinium_carterae.1
MAYPQILTTITRLACNITKWTEDDDRRLHHLVCFMNGYSHSHVLTGQALRDKGGHVHCRLSCYSDAELAGHGT